MNFPEEKDKLEQEEGRLQILAQNALGVKGYEILADRISREARSRANWEEQELYAKAWAKWPELQYLMVFEEFAELQKELVKQLRGKGDTEHIQEEIADCLIMLEQLMVKHGRTFILEKKAEKIQRLKKLLG
jgi:NTP pyrophosphatase (non-canonical NTP hydrolase)